MLYIRVDIRVLHDACLRLVDVGDGAPHLGVLALPLVRRGMLHTAPLLLVPRVEGVLASDDHCEVSSSSSSGTTSPTSPDCTYLVCL